jgi:Tfp pilus assembly protein PilF
MESLMSRARHGLQTTTRLFGAVVEQCVQWGPKNGRSTAWTQIPAPVESTKFHPLAEARWSNNSDVEIRNANPIPSEPGRWEWSNGAGVEIEYERIEMKVARRTSGEAWGDVALLVMMLSLVVGMSQLNYIFRAWLGAQPVETHTMDPSPELIARLLKQEFGGGEHGPVARVQRTEFKRTAPTFYLPAGSNGPMDKVGGGEVAGPQPNRTPPAQDPVHAKALKRDGDVDLVAEVDAVDPLSTQDPGIEGLHPQPVEESSDEDSALTSVERFVGWGFHDWLDVAEANDTADKEMTERLRLARELMKIDPDDPFAMLTIAYYSYLSENYEMCRELYHRYITLYPEDAAGWNNLALTYKRTGEYAEEERLYRRSIALDPENSNTKNNLAVNLAHQGRYREAEEMMASLRPSPKERPYAELHRAKIAAEQGKDRKAYRHLKRALAEVDVMDTFHHIEFRQDPSLSALRARRRTRRLLESVYGDDSPLKLGANRRARSGVADG